MPFSQPRAIPALLLCALFVLAFAFQGSRGIYSPDEGYYACIAREMVRTGDFWIPRLNGEPWLDKPPLGQWGIAAGLILFGHDEWGARLFHGVCYVLTTLLVGLLAGELGTRRQGWLAGAIFATMLLPYSAANVLTPDTPLTLWTTAAFYGFWMSVRQHDRPGGGRVRLWQMLMCLAFGLGFLTKGPAALIPAGAMFVFLLPWRRAFAYFFTPWAILGVGLFVLTGMAWYFSVARLVPGAADYFWDNQVLGRTVSSKYARNPGPAGALIYPPTLLLGALPWSFLWIAPLRRHAGKLFRPAAWRELSGRPEDLFVALWIAIPTIVLCLASSKLLLYALPVFPGLAIATARLPRWRAPADAEGATAWRPSGAGSAALALWIVFLVGVKAAAAWMPHEYDMRALYAEIEPHLPERSYEIVCYKEHYEGLAFYDRAHVERVTTEEDNYPFFAQAELIDDEIEESLTHYDFHALVCQKQKYADDIVELLEKCGLPYTEHALSFDRHLFVCPVRKPARPLPAP